MVEGIAKFILGLEGLGLVICLILIVYLIFRRIKIREQENFEDRDN